jgi:hypothetical protein
VREIDDLEIDADEIEAKTKRDLGRLLEVVKMTQADGVRGFCGRTSIERVCHGRLGVPGQACSLAGKHGRHGRGTHGVSLCARR